MSPDEREDAAPVNAASAGQAGTAGPVAGPLDTDIETATATMSERLEPMIRPDDMPAVGTIIRETIAQVSHHSGPLPRAEELEQYNRIDAGFAERIVAMAEREQAFRHDLPRQALEREDRIKSRGQHYALVLVALILCFAGYLAFLGDTNMAGTVALGTLVGIVGIMVGGRAIDAWGGAHPKADEDD